MAVDRRSFLEWSSLAAVTSAGGAGLGTACSRPSTPPPPGGKADRQVAPTRTHSIVEWGAKLDGKRREDATISSGSLNVVSCAGYKFTASDIGKTIIIGSHNTKTGITSAGGTRNQAHITTIASLSGNNAVLATPAARAVSGANVAWGTDDGVAWRAALTAMINANNAQLTMPAGISICGQAISLAPKNNVETFSLRGASLGTSRIISTASGGFLTLNLTGSTDGGEDASIDFADLSIATAVAGATTALTVEVVQGGVVQERVYIARNILCSGFDFANGYFNKAIVATGMYLPLFDNVMVTGVWAAIVGSSPDYSDSSTSFLAQIGIQIDGTYGPYLTNVIVWNCFRAIQHISAVFNEPQGSMLTDCIIVNCREGLYWQGPGLPPVILIKGGQYANRDFNICLNGWRNGIISHSSQYMPQIGWAPSSTLATAVNTGITPTTLTLASTTNFMEAGAVLIGSEWFTYNNLTTGMDGTTLQNVARAQFGTGDPGSNYAIGTTVQATVADILLIGCNTVRIDSNIFEYQPASAKRINVLIHSGNANCSVMNSRHDTNSYAVAIGKGSTGTELLHNSHGTGMTQVLDGASDTIYKSGRARSCRLVKTAGLSIPHLSSTPTTITWDSKDWDTEGFWLGSGDSIIVPKNRGIKRVRITANAVFTASASGSRMIEVSYDGVYSENGNGYRAQPAASVNFPSGIGTTCELKVVGGDVIRIAVAQDSGATLYIGAGTAAETWVICEVIEGA